MKKIKYLGYSLALVFVFSIGVVNCGGGSSSDDGTIAPDTTAPVITLNGDNPMTLMLGDTYNEPGATATDNVDGSVAVAITGNVDTSTAGTYTIIYATVDSANNPVVATRTVNVILPPDTTAPVITILGNNPETVEQNSIYIDAGATALDDRDGTVSASASGDVNTSKIGTYTIAYTATDSSNNTRTVTRTVNVISAPNTPPVADAGLDQTVYVGNIVTLDGSGSSDEDNDTLTYSWSFTSKPIGSSASLSSTSVEKPTFMADAEGSYIIQLTVNDGNATSNADRATVMSEYDTRYDTVDHDEGVFQ